MATQAPASIDRIIDGTNRSELHHNLQLIDRLAEAGELSAKTVEQLRQTISNRLGHEEPPALEKNSEPWEELKGRDAWKLREFGLICIGLDPTPYRYPNDRARYNR